MNPIFTQKINDIKETNHTILSLLPYSDEAELINKHQKTETLYLLKSIVEFSILALEEFKIGNLAQFDAQVGENLCQIRACNIVYLGKKWLESLTKLEEFRQKIEEFRTYKNNIQNVINNWEQAIQQSVSYDKNLDPPEKIIFFLERHQLLKNNNEEFFFIITCFFLTHFNILGDNIPIAINLNYISQEFNISKYRAKRLTHKYQQLVCNLGCKFIHQIAQSLPKELEYETIIPKLYKISDEERAVLPCYFVSSIIFHHSILTQIPTLLIVKRIDKNNSDNQDIIYFLLVGNPNQNCYQLIHKTSMLENYCLVVAGVVPYEKETIEHYTQRILSEGLLKVILANTASHPQYSGKKLEKWRYDPYTQVELTEKAVTNHAEKFYTMRDYALHAGCSKENQSTFFLRHIYASKIIDELTQLHQKNQVVIYDAYDIKIQMDSDLIEENTTSIIN